MYVTTRFIGTERGTMNYLFLLLTEDYIEENRKIAEGITPLLNRFARKIGDTGALVRPFPGDEEETLGNALSKNWTEGQIMHMRGSLPALLVIDKDFDEFNPTDSNYIYISLRSSIDEYGNVKLFQLQELLTLLADACATPELFSTARKYLRVQDKRVLWEALELKPEVVGFSFDLKKGAEFLRLLSQRRQSFGTA